MHCAESSQTRIFPVYLSIKLFITGVLFWKSTMPWPNRLQTRYAHKYCALVFWFLFRFSYRFLFSDTRHFCSAIYKRMSTLHGKLTTLRQGSHSLKINSVSNYSSFVRCSISFMDQILITKIDERTLIDKKIVSMDGKQLVGQLDLAREIVVLHWPMESFWTVEPWSYQ